MATKPPMPAASAASAPTEDAATRRIRMIAEDRDKRAAMDRAYNAANKTPSNPAETYSKGGTASSRADGCAQRGKTRGTMVMCGGGKTK